MVEELGKNNKQNCSLVGTEQNSEKYYLECLLILWGDIME
jgi:hypothetical protein